MVTWTDREGNVHDVATMDPRHAANVLAYLERKAVVILNAHAWRAMELLPDDTQVGEMTLDILEREVHHLWDLADKARSDHRVAIDWLWADRGDLMRALVARAVPEAHEVTCPTCGAKPLVKCRTKSGRPARYHHAARDRSRRIDEAVAARRGCRHEPVAHGTPRPPGLRDNRGRLLMGEQREACGRYLADGHVTYDPDCDACVEANSDAPEWTL